MLVIFVSFGCNNPKGESVLGSGHTPFLSAPGDFSFQQIRSQNGTVNLTWVASPRAATYAFTMGTSAGDISTPVPTCSSTSPTCTLTGLDANTTYYFSVEASNAAGTKEISNYGAALSVGTFSITSSSAGNGFINLAWGAANNATAYDVIYGTSSGAYPSVVSNVVSPYVLNGLINGVSYYVQVVARNGQNGYGLANAEATQQPTGPPSAPTGLAASALPSQVTLTWTPVPGASSYNVYRSVSSGATVLFASGVVPATYTDATVANGTTYYYTVTAHNGLESPKSSEVSIRPEAAPSIVSITPPSNDTYSAGEQLNYTVRFSEPITVTGFPELAIAVGAQNRRAVYVSGSTTTDLVFRYTVVLSDEDPNGVATVSPLHLAGGTLRNAGGLDADLTFAGATAAGVIVANAASITNVAAPANGNYNRATAASVSFTLTYSELVNVINFPRLTLNVGGETRYATYTGGTGSANLTFTYTVTGTDLDLDGISVASPVDLNGGSIRNAAGIDSNLTFTAPSTSGVNVVYPNLVAWYDAQDSSTLFQNSACSVPVASDGQSVGCFRDKSGNGHHALQATAGIRPVYRTSGVQALPSLRFDGVDDMLTAADHANFNNMAGLTAIVVFVPQTLNGEPRALVSKRLTQASTTFSLFLYTGNRISMDISTSGNRQNSARIFAINNPYLVTMHFDGSLAAASRTKFYVDGSLDITLTSNTGTAGTSSGGFHVGSLNENYGVNKTFHGFIGEVFFFRRSLGTTAGNELQRMHQYIQTKWAL